METILNSSIINTIFFGALQPAFWVYAVYILCLTHITIAAVTIFLHRSQAHRSVELHPIISHFFRFWLWLTTGMITREWAAVHRKHHAKAETPEDPHSPQVYGVFSVLFCGAAHYVRAKRDREMVERYGYGTPDDWVENNVYTPLCKWGVTLMAFINVGLFGVIPGMLVWTVQMLWIPFWAAGVVNGIGHFWGYRTFQPQDESRNIVPLGVVIGGEELHNNHHAFPTSARLSNRWYEFDIGWLYIRLFEIAGMAKVKRIAPKLLSADSRATCDLDMLQSIITNRLEVLSRFSASVKKSCHKELQRVARAGNKVPTTAVVNNWLHGMERRLNSMDKQAIGKLIEDSPRIAKIDELRRELVSLWEDRTVSPEDLVQRLRDWCVKAEKSDIVPLSQFSTDLRGYRTAPVA
ncbi:MAG: fatty acid desaturase [Proteobacteria bacterium]|nr:fatty acid desaturase [Pseudomonadota bacterium]